MTAILGIYWRRCMAVPRQLRPFLARRLIWRNRPAYSVKGLEIKRGFDPGNLFRVHHGVGSEVSGE
jgi:hypothetical protein